MSFCKYNDVYGRFRLNTKVDESLHNNHVYNVLSTKVLMRKRWYDYLTLTLIAGIIALPLVSFSDASPGQCRSKDPFVVDCGYTK